MIYSSENLKSDGTVNAPAWNVFDGNSSTVWFGQWIAMPGYIGFHFNRKRCIKQVYLLHWGDRTYTFYIQASDDGINWTNISEQLTIRFPNSSSPTTIDVPGNTKYYYWRNCYDGINGHFEESYPNLQNMLDLYTLQYYGY